MQYTVSHNGVTCQLPAYTMGIKKKIDVVNERSESKDILLENKLEAMHAFLKEVAGSDTVHKMLGSEELDEIDLNDMGILYLKIAKEYDRPVVEFNRPEMDPESKKVLQDLDKAAKNITAIQQATAK